MARSKRRRTSTIQLNGFSTVIQKLRTLETEVQQKVARTAAMRVVKGYLYPRLVNELGQFDGQDVTIDATDVRLLPKRKYRNGAQMHIPYKKVVRLYKQRYDQEPGSKRGEEAPHYYPWVLEFGTPDLPAEKPVRRSAYAVRGGTKREFARELIKELKKARSANYGR